MQHFRGAVNLHSSQGSFTFPKSRERAQCIVNESIESCQEKSNIIRDLETSAKTNNTAGHPKTLLSLVYLSLKTDALNSWAPKRILIK